jgi:hydroxyacylglutathione hydrolase
MKVSKHIHVLRIPFKITISPEISIDRFVNCFIIEGKKITLIDTGVSGSEKYIFDYLKSIGRKASEINQVLLTHTHPDHIGALKVIKDETGCKVGVHKEEREWVENIDKQFSERPVPGFHNLVGGSCKIDFLLTDGETIDLGNNQTIQVIHTPGHSAGSVSFQIQPENVLITGDAIPVKNDIPIYDNWQTSLKSLEKIENMQFPDILLSSWDTPKEGGLVEETISEGFETIYAVHQAWLEVHKEYTDLQALSKAVLEKMGLPAKIVNPLFARAVKSHAIKTVK